MIGQDEPQEIDLESIVNIDDEIREYETRLKEEPTNDRVLAKLSDLYVERNDPTKNDSLEKAKNYASEALKYNKGNILALTNLGYIAYLRDYDWFGCGHHSRRAEYYLKKAIKAGETNGLNDKECINIADLAHCIERNDIVTEYVLLSLQKNPRNVKARLYQIGEIRQTDSVKAEEDIRNILGYPPLHLDVHWQFANILFDNKKYEESRKRKEYALEIAKRRGLNALLWLFS